MDQLFFTSLILLVAGIVFLILGYVIISSWNLDKNTLNKLAKIDKELSTYEDYVVAWELLTDFKISKLTTNWIRCYSSQSYKPLSWIEPGTSVNTMRLRLGIQKARIINKGAD